MRIAGAGLAGLIAAHAWPQAPLFEPQSGPRAEHRALLRFRSRKVEQLTGIEFRAVTVRKGIWVRGEFVAPNIRIANMYSQKILGSVQADRSIWSIEPVERYIAPETLYDQLIESVGSRVHWGEACGFENPSSPIINTAPMPVVLEALGWGTADPSIQFKRAPIFVRRYRVEGCATHQTIYYPDPALSVYRATITGDLLIVESTGDYFVMDAVMEAFGIRPDRLQMLEQASQSYGKIVPLPDESRKALMLRLTQERGIFSLGRFATWRNILLDDVVDDITVIRRLLRVSHYDRSIALS